MTRRDALKNAVLGTIGVAFFPRLLAENHYIPLLNRADFGNDFRWGVATAAYQIEGAHDADGKGKSIWDTFSHKKGKIERHENGDIACDFYHNYASDIALIKDMNMNVNRFSISWSRIFPEGIGKKNQAGIDFYHNVIDKCLALNIEPWITLYHWDLPQALADKGGWTNREVISWFSEFAEFCTKEYGGKVKNWMVLNEPMAFTTLGYLVGTHAPGKRSVRKWLAAVHHATMCQAEGGRIIRKNVEKANIGTTFSCSHIDPKTEKPVNIAAARRCDALINRLFIEPALGLGYPMADFPILKKMTPFIKTGDEEKMIFDFDFIGIQNYTRIIVYHSLLIPVLWSMQVPVKKRNNPYTEMKWEVYPEGIYHLLKKFAAYKSVKNIMVTENGAAFPDKVENGAIHDKERTEFFKNYLTQVLRAKKEGVPVKGYFVWSLMDNFEWSFGYRPRFGLVYVDFTTQKRYLKDSALWFKDFLAR